MTELSFSVVSHGHGPLLRRLLSQLDAEVALKGARIVVTLNLSHETFDAAQYPSLDMIVIRNDVPRGFGANHNAAFARCDSRWFAILNPDLALAGPEPFTDMVAHGVTSTVPNITVIAPLVVSADLVPEDSVRTNLTPWSLVRRRLLGDRKPLDIRRAARRGAPFYWLAGMCLLVRTDAFRTLGGFDERFFLYCEDYDLCARMYNRGYALMLDAEVRIIHEAQRDSHRSLRHLRWHLTSLLKVWLSAAFWRVTFASSRSRR